MKLLFYCYSIIAVLCTLYVLIYQITHPELTSMQVSINVWPMLLMIVLTSFAAAVIMRKVKL